MTNLLKAENAFNMAQEYAKDKLNSDISKTQTIMKNIVQRSKNGLFYYDYQASINYAIAKTLTELGYKMYLFRKDLTSVGLEEFKQKNIRGIRIDWSNNV